MAANKSQFLIFIPCVVPSSLSLGFSMWLVLASGRLASMMHAEAEKVLRNWSFSHGMWGLFRGTVPELSFGGISTQSALIAPGHNSDYDIMVFGSVQIL